MATWLHLMRIVMALSLFTAVGITPLSAAGRTNKSLANTILSGKAVPTSKVGINGDFYINTSTFQIYGPKVNNRWPAPISLIGPTGNAGSDGKQGDKGSSSSGDICVIDLLFFKDRDVEPFGCIDVWILLYVVQFKDV